MGVIDEVKPTDSSKDNPSLPVNPSLSSSKNGKDSADASVPQMLITSVEEVNQEIEHAGKEKEQIAGDEKPVLTTIKEENEEEKEIREKRDVSSSSSSAQQRPLVISTLSELSRVAVAESSYDHEKPPPPPRTESPPLSAIQRPLVLEQVLPQSISPGVSEAQQESVHDHMSSTSPSAVQRPLVFDGSSVPFDSPEQVSSSHLGTEVSIDLRGQNAALGYVETSPVLSARVIEETSDEVERDIAAHDVHRPDGVSSSPLGGLESPTSKLKGLFTKADGTPLFSLPKLAIGSPKEGKDSAHQTTIGETHVESEKVLSTDKNVDYHVKEDSKSAFSLPKFSFGSSKDPKLKEHKDSSHGQSSPSAISPDSAAVGSDVDGKEHSKEGSKVTFSLPKFSFSTSKEMPKEPHDASLSQAAESYPSSSEGVDPGSHSPDVGKDGSKHGFHLPKFSFGSPKESKEVSKEQQDSSLNQSVESRPSSAEAANRESYSAEAVKDGSKHGFHLPKFSFGSSKENKEVSKEQQDSSLNQSIESRPSSAEAANLESYSAEAVKDGSRHGFHLPKFSFGSSKESKEVSKEQQDSSLNQSVESRPSSAGSAPIESHSVEAMKEESKFPFSLPKLHFGSSKEVKEVSKQTKDESAVHSISAENSPSSVEVTYPDTAVKEVKDDSRHAFQFPKFGFGSSKEPKDGTKEPTSASPIPASEIAAETCPPESGKPVFSLPKFSFGISKEHKDVKDASHVQSASSEGHSVSIEAKSVDVTSKDASKVVKHSFSFPKLSLGSPKSPRKETQDTAGIPSFVIEDVSSTEGAKADARAGIKRSFSFPKFGFGSSKEDEVTKEMKHPSKVSKTDADIKTASVGESRHVFSFPKISLSSSKEPKESTKPAKDGTKTEPAVIENVPVPSGSVDTSTAAKDVKPFSFPKISFGSFREPKGTAKEQKDLHDHPVPLESHQEISEVKVSDKGQSASFQKPAIVTLKEDGDKSPEAEQAVQKMAPRASEEKDPFKKEKKPKDTPERSSSFKLFKKETKETKEIEKQPQTGETPSSLYETCCMRLAGMICNKAMEIVSEHTTKRGPPKKPPKPSAEAIAKARAAIVAKRVKEYERRKNFGDDIPIRFVDDDTESSNDYKDVDSSAYIIDSDVSMIVQRMKLENTLESFSCPSISSYYTADEITLKDGNFSDNTLESVSLGSEDSLVYKPALSSLSDEHRVSLKVDEVEQQKTDSVKKPVEKQKSSPVSFFFFGRSKNVDSPKETPAPVVQKRVPPPVPPKPSNWPRSESQVQIESTVSTVSIESEVQKRVDPLSLSPRPVLRNLPATCGIKKRPLTIASVKETEFPLYTRNIGVEEIRKKPVLTAVVKNQSLQDVPTISASTSDLDRSLSPQSKPPVIHTTSLSSLAKKPAPQRPPPPVKYAKSSSALHIETVKSTGPPPEVIGKPKSESSVVSPPHKPPICKPRPHISPPRPPPPKIKTVPSPPPRPPPPSLKITSKISQSSPEIHKQRDDTTELQEKPVVDSGQSNETVTKENDLVKGEAICDTSEVKDETRAVIPLVDVCTLSADAQQPDLSSKLDSNLKTDVQTADFDKGVLNVVDITSTISSVDTTSSKQTEAPEVQTSSGDHIIQEKLPVPCDDTSKIAESSAPVPMARGLKKPRPPPRVRRIRSRTVEVVPVVWKPEERRRRSQSLSEIDVKKRLNTEDVSHVDEKHELKALYTSVNKDPTKCKDEQLKVDSESIRKSQSPENISSRPLPPPPPPPRSKHHSDMHKPKQGDIDQNKNIFHETPEKCTDHEQEADKPSIKPPVRKKKEDKTRSQSLEDKNKGAKISPLSGRNGAVSIDRAHSFTSGVPKKPKRKQKISSHEFHFDENANIAESVDDSSAFTEGYRTASSHSDLGVFSASQNLVREQRSSSEKQVKRRSPALDVSSKKSHSSWYDESDVSGDLGDVDTLPGSLKTSTEKLNLDLDSSNPNKNKQLRVKEESSKKPRETSKFYVDISTSELEEIPPSPAPSHTTTVDKETSPLPLECSEKSVQTSLETLSQGMVSRSEQSDDTDELLNLAQTLQDELKTILGRNKKQGPEGESDNDTSGSQNLLDSPGAFEKAGPSSVKRRERKPHSTHAAASSDVWQVSSSDESDECTEDQVKIPSETLLERRKKKVFYVAREIMTSEETFVDALKLLNIDFRNVIDEANKQRGSPVVPSEVVNQILNHLPQLQHLNENLLMELKDRIQNWDNLDKIADVIVKMGPFLKLYSWYIQDFESMVSLLDDAKKKYPLFAQVVKEFENTQRCNRLSLSHYMLRPVQRIPQYRLLLQEYLHHLPKDSPDYNDTLTALQIVSEVANHANESMKQGDNFQKLISIQNSIIGHKEIIKPGRVFVKEGELMKLSRKGMQPRWFVLLSDVLLYLTPVQQGLFRVNHELILTGMKVAIPIQQDYQNEFSIISVTRSFTLAAKSPEERQEWIVALTKAIEENASKRSTFTNVRLQQKSEVDIDEDDDALFVLGRKAPVWIPDARVTMCQLCTSEFTVTFRRHHCRACGKVVCSICSSNRAALHYLGNRNARVCDECYLKLEQGSGGGYTESGETDSDNQQIAVKAHLRTDSRYSRKPKRQLPSVLKEVCANDQGSSISGYLLKRSGKSWKRDWFVVKDKVLYEYKASEDVAALRSLPLLGYQIETFSESFEGTDSKLLFQLSHPGQPPVVFHADSAAAAERWIAALKEATVLE